MLATLTTKVLILTRPVNIVTNILTAAASITHEPAAALCATPELYNSGIIFRFPLPAAVTNQIAMLDGSGGQ